MSTAPLLEARGLSKIFSVKPQGRAFARRRPFRAVDDVSVSLGAGRVTAVVGESGSGKSVLARMLARTVEPSEGELFVEGAKIDPRERRDLAYTAAVQLVLQDPFASINPVHPIRHVLERPLKIHGNEPSLVPGLAKELLERVALTPGESYLDRFPHELSGGQLQRVSIARALSVRPKVLLADEPISMLDVSVRLGVLNLLRDLCDNEQLAVLYITHDIASARYIADDVLVMYAGQVVESANGTTVVDRPRHPYTQLLVSSVPDPGQGDRPRMQAPSATAFPEVGCRFAPRCPLANEQCRAEVPTLVEVEPSHHVRCWRVEEASVLLTSRDSQKGGGETT
ncbi:MAG: ABC transporter ATP-binding protein [Acidobacteria bacterium]|nr:ABC transporter ATP-binding protein [Acidobacteriota bacterium]